MIPALFICLVLLRRFAGSEAEPDKIGLLLSQAANCAGN